MSIKLHYNQETGFILGYFPDYIEYPSIPEPYIEISEEDHLDCVNNQSTRKVDVTKKEIIEYMPTGPTLDEIKKQKLSALDAEYQPQFLELARAWADASMDAKTELANSIAADRLALKQEYEQKRGEING